MCRSARCSRENEIAHILSESEAKVVVMVPSAWNNDLLGIVQRLRPTLPHLEKVVLWSDTIPEGCRVLTIS